MADVMRCRARLSADISPGQGDMLEVQEVSHDRGCNCKPTHKSDELSPGHPTSYIWSETH